MAGNDRTDSARPVNTFPILQPGCVYRISALKWSEDTWAKLKRNGLKIYQPGKERIVFADDVMAAIRKMG